MLDVLDQFRKEVLDEYVPLPAPVVSVNTLSGKGTVLQRLTIISRPGSQNVHRNKFKRGDARLNVEQASAEEIDDAERDAPQQTCLGLDALRSRLNLTVHDNIIRALPSIRQRLQIKLSGAQDGLKKVGDGRSDNTSMRVFLVNLSMRFTRRPAMHFIGQDAWSDEMTDIRRLRIRVAKANDHFTHDMLVYGADPRIDKPINVDPGCSEATEEHGNDTHSQWAQGIQLVRRDQALKWIQSEIVSMRGSEVPSEPIPGIETCLHRQLIVKWDKLCDSFLQHLLRAILGTLNRDVLNGLYSHVKQAMSVATEAAFVSMQGLVIDERVGRMTDNGENSVLVARQLYERSTVISSTI
ncbi:P-loop containing nucleoside triphosphate hydrolase protein, partial [Teratosphaeria destructans]